MDYANFMIMLNFYLKELISEAEENLEKLDTSSDEELTDVINKTNKISKELTTLTNLINMIRENNFE